VENLKPINQHVSIYGFVPNSSERPFEFSYTLNIRAKLTDEPEWVYLNTEERGQIQVTCEKTKDFCIWFALARID
jgi:hypothetical protein